MSREKMDPGLDKHIFKRTAVRTKRVNIVPYVSRGGIRL